MLKNIAASADGEALPTNVVSMPWPWGSSFASQCRQQVGLQRVCGDRHLPRASG